jgi:hypothetical protein
MRYKEQVENHLSSLEGKLRIIENVVTGAMRMSHEELLQVIEDTKKVSQRIAEFVSIESPEL